jgi:hypothetical protein
MRKAGYVVACFVILVALALVAIVVGEHATHPRDEDAYIAYLHGDYDADAGQTQEAVGELPPTTALVAEGDRACNWLGDQPTALWRTSNDYRFPALMARYRHAVRGSELTWGDAPPDHYTVATAAWAHLCPATWQLHKPHYVFSDPNPGD